LQTLPVTPTPPVADYAPPPAPVGDSMPNVQSYAPLVVPNSTAIAEDTWKTPIIIQDQPSKDLPITANDSFSRNARGRSSASSVVRVQSDNMADASNLPWGQEFNNGWNAPSPVAAPKPANQDEMPWLNSAQFPGGLNVQQPMPYLQTPNYPPIGPDLSITMPPANASTNLPALVPPTSSPVAVMPPVAPMAMPSPYNMVPPLVPPSDLAVWNKWSGNTIQPPMVVEPPPMVTPFVTPSERMGTVMPYDPIAGSMLNYQQRMQQSAPYTSGAPYAPYGKDFGWWYNNPNWSTYAQNRNTPLTSPLSNDRFDKPPVSLTKPVATIYFKDDSTALDAGDTKVLKQLADWFENRGGGLRVVGHSSSRTKDMDAAKQKMRNYKLSLDRAESVGKKLQSMGVAKNKLNVAARGDSEKQFAESMPSGDAWNRRVEIYWDMF
jgi:outer membrane protein OmpA-like peptidoglycan-associated protein